MAIIIFAVTAFHVQSHTCEGGAHPSMSFWHLLMNLQNNYLLKKLLKRVNKKVKILIFELSTVPEI